jgi:PhnB protein
MLKSSPFILFNGECAAAMNFYHNCIGGDLTITKLSDTPMKDQFPPEKHGRIIYSQLIKGDIDISAVDWMSEEVTRMPGNNVGVYIIGKADDEFISVFKKLSVGAAKDATLQELHELPIGLYGQFTDKFGIHWTFKGDNK